MCVFWITLCKTPFPRYPHLILHSSRDSKCSLTWRHSAFTWRHILHLVTSRTPSRYTSHQALSHVTPLSPTGISTMILYRDLCTPELIVTTIMPSLLHLLDDADRKLLFHSGIFPQFSSFRVIKIKVQYLKSLSILWRNVLQPTFRILIYNFTVRRVYFTASRCTRIFN